MAQASRALLLEKKRCFAACSPRLHRVVRVHLISKVRLPRTQDEILWRLRSIGDGAEPDPWSITLMIWSPSEHVLPLTSVRALAVRIHHACKRAMSEHSGNKRKRSAIACTVCHDRKVRCNAASNGIPCSNCILDGTPCRIYGRRPSM